VRWSRAERRIQPTLGTHGIEVASCVIDPVRRDVVQGWSPRLSPEGLRGLKGVFPIDVEVDRCCEAVGEGLVLDVELDISRRALATPPV
jgi:hypothetical protein